jgi:tetratricopeptide (TPR) repeat protein
VIAFLLALAAAQAQPQTPPGQEQALEAEYARCTELVKSDAEKAIRVAGDWRLRGGGIYARQCLGLAYVQLERWAPAATAFEQAAQDAERARDGRRADFWVQSGNAWLAANEPAKARAAFDAALATTLLTPELRGEVYLDRGRAGVALGDLPGARKDLDEGVKLVPGDPFGWYLSSALAVRLSDLPRAQSDIAEAVRLAPDNADLLLHAGNVAGLSGEVDAAKGLYMKVIRVAPNSPAAAAARAALAANPDQPAPAQSK